MGFDHAAQAMERLETSVSRARGTSNRSPPSQSKERQDAAAPRRVATTRAMLQASANTPNTEGHGSRSGFPSVHHRTMIDRYLKKSLRGTLRVPRTESKASPTPVGRVVAQTRHRSPRDLTETAGIPALTRTRLIVMTHKSSLKMRVTLYWGWKNTRAPPAHNAADTRHAP